LIWRGMTTRRKADAKGVVRRRHDDDAGGDRAVLAAKAVLREEIWAGLAAGGVSRFPGPDRRIPNFVGAEAAAERLRELTQWRTAATVKANPDSPQLPVRQRALEDGKTVFMAVPRLAGEAPFFRLDAARLPVRPRQAASIKGASRHGEPVTLDQLEPVDLAIVGCVAVSPEGARLGKGGGFSDLEYGLAYDAGLIDDLTVMVTTVHELQVVDSGRIPETDHDFRLDVIVTPERVINCRGTKRRDVRPGIRWHELTDAKIDAIPVLQRLRP
jgi:5-formyltetrahydrofolate cyclo-ligase